MKEEVRTEIPAELRRRILIESGHRCAIPSCKQTEVDLHHIIPWEECKKHEYENLIALCPNCHRRAHKGEIDRKSLRLYKNIKISKTDHGEVREGIVALDISKSILHTLTVAGNINITTNGWSGGVEKMFLVIANCGSYGVVWNGFDSLPFVTDENFSFSKDGIDILEITSYDGLICMKGLESNLR